MKKRVLSFILVLCMMFTLMPTAALAADKVDIPSDASEFDGHYYKVFPANTVKTWEEAKLYCEELGGYLAVIASKEENAFLNDLIYSQGIKNAYFGYSDAEIEGTWKWVPNEESNYTNWHSNQPDHETSKEDYAEFYWKWSDGTWNDGNFGNGTASDSTAFICEWATLSDVKNEDRTVVYSDNKSLSYVVGDDIYIAVSRLEDGNLVKPEHISFTVSDESVVSYLGITSYSQLMQFFKDAKLKLNYTGNIPAKFEDCYFVKFSANSSGAATVIVTNSDTGETVNVPIKVAADTYEAFRADNVKQYTYKCTSLETDYYNTYINGMWIADFACTPTDGGYNYSMNVYNESFINGVVEVYNADGKLRNVVVIDKYEYEQTSLINTIDSGLALINDIVKWDVLSFRSSSTSKHTPVNVYVPKDGYIRITNDSTISTPCYVLNMFDFVLSACKVIEGIQNIDVDSVDIVTENAMKLLVQDTFSVKAAEKFQKKLTEKIVKDYTPSAFLGLVADVSKDAKLFLAEADIDIADLLNDTGTSIAEDIFERLSGEAGLALSVLFYAQDVCNLYLEGIYLTKYINTGKLFEVHSPRQASYTSGELLHSGSISADTNGNVPDNTLFQAFRLVNEDYITVTLNSGEVQYSSTIYNICMYLDGNEIQPDGEVTVYIPKPENCIGKNIKIYRENQSGEWELIDSRIDGGMIVFSVDHFCRFAVCEIPIGEHTHNYVDGVCTRCGEADPNYVPPVKDNPFVDVQKGSVYYDAILWAYYHTPEQITGGFTATEFRPQNPCTRAQVVTFLWRAKGCPEPTTTDNPFSDVSAKQSNGKDNPYYKAILWAAEEGITTGYAGGLFKPNDTVTRAQFVTFLWRADGKPATTGSINGFADAGQIASPYQQAVAWAVEKGITTGYEDNTFRPNDPCKRWAVVLFMYRDMT